MSMTWPKKHTFLYKTYNYTPFQIFIKASFHRGAGIKKTHTWPGGHIWVLQIKIRQFAPEEQTRCCTYHIIHLIMPATPPHTEKVCILMCKLRNSL